MDIRLSIILVESFRFIKQHIQYQYGHTAGLLWRNIKRDKRRS